MKVVEPKEGEVFDIELEEDILKANEELARQNKKLLDKHKILAIDIMGSIGSGKTSLIEKLVEKLKNKYKIGVIAGDLTTTIDADRIKKHEVKVVQINTGKECHLDANLVKGALKELDLKNLDLLFIENVGNLICPAEFPLGSHKRIVVISVTEGPYMIIKHPFIFQDADIVAINKIDLTGAMGVNPSKLEKDAKKLNPDITAIRTNCLTGYGTDGIIESLFE